MVVHLRLYSSIPPGYVHTLLLRAVLSQLIRCCVVDCKRAPQQQQSVATTISRTRRRVFPSCITSAKHKQQISSTLFFTHSLRAVLTTKHHAAGFLSHISRLSLGFGHFHRALFPPSHCSRGVTSRFPMSDEKMTSCIPLSRLADAISRFLCGEKVLDGAYEPYAILFAHITFGAACSYAGYKLYRLFIRHKDDKAKIKLAVFHVLRVLRQRPDYERLLRNPQELVAEMNIEVVDMIEGRLSKIEVNNVVRELKRKVVNGEMPTPMNPLRSSSPSLPSAKRRRLHQRSPSPPSPVGASPSTSSDSDDDKPHGGGGFSVPYLSESEDSVVDRSKLSPSPAPLQSQNPPSSPSPTPSPTPRRSQRPAALEPQEEISRSYPFPYRPEDGSNHNNYDDDGDVVMEFSPANDEPAPTSSPTRAPLPAIPPQATRTLSRRLTPLEQARWVIQKQKAGGAGTPLPKKAVRPRSSFEGTPPPPPTMSNIEGYSAEKPTALSPVEEGDSLASVHTESPVRYRVNETRSLWGGMLERREKSRQARRHIVPPSPPPRLEQEEEFAADTASQPSAPSTPASDDFEVIEAQEVVVQSAGAVAGGGAPRPVEVGEEEEDNASDGAGSNVQYPIEVGSEKLSSSSSELPEIETPCPRRRVRPARTPVTRNVGSDTPRRSTRANRFSGRYGK